MGKGVVCSTMTTEPMRKVSPSVSEDESFSLDCGTMTQLLCSPSCLGARVNASQKTLGELSVLAALSSGLYVWALGAGSLEDDATAL